MTLYHAHLASSFLPDDTVDQIASLGQTMLVLLFAIPLFIGIATYVSPLQVGARTVAFPRAAAMAFWGWVLGSGMLIAGYAINGGPGGGRPKAVDLSFMGLAFVIASICVASVCLLTTIIAMRTAGLWMSRLPLFSWSIVVACSLWLFTLPVLLGNVLLVYIDHHYGTGTVLGDVGVGPAVVALRPARHLHRRHPGARCHQRHPGHALGPPARRTGA